MTLSRARRGGFASWWWTVDRVALFAMFALIAIGLMLAFAASPAATGGPMSAGDFRYAAKQIVFAVDCRVAFLPLPRCSRSAPSSLSRRSCSRLR